MKKLLLLGCLLSSQAVAMDTDVDMELKPYTTTPQRQGTKRGEQPLASEDQTPALRRRLVFPVPGDIPMSGQAAGESSSSFSAPTVSFPGHDVAWVGSMVQCKLLMASHSPNKILFGPAATDTSLDAKSLRNVLGDAGLVELLITWGANPQACDGMRGTPLHAAAAQGNLPLVNTLLGHLSADDLMREGCREYTPLCYALNNAHSEVFATLLDAARAYGLFNDCKGKALLEKLYWMACERVQDVALGLVINCAARVVEHK